MGAMARPAVLALCVVLIALVAGAVVLLLRGTGRPHHKMVRTIEVEIVRPPAPPPSSNSSPR